MILQREKNENKKTTRGRMMMKTNISETYAQENESHFQKTKELQHFSYLGNWDGLSHKITNFGRIYSPIPSPFFFISILGFIYPWDACSDFCLFFHFHFKIFFEKINQSRYFPIITET
jgi:hypothetical protein